MWRCLALILVCGHVSAGLARGQEQEIEIPLDFLAARSTDDARPPAGPSQPATAPTPDLKGPDTLQGLQDQLARTAAELKTLKEQNERELEEQRKRMEIQEKQIQLLERTAKLLAEQLKQQAEAPTATEDVEKLQGKTAVLESRAKQAAERDVELARKTDELSEKLDATERYGPRLPATLKELFLPSYTNETPLSIYGQFLGNYTKQNGRNGFFSSPDFSPYFLLQLNKRFLLEANLDISHAGGVDIGIASLDMFVNNWMTLVAGRYLTPIGFFNEELNHEWINKLPDPPLMFNQVSPLTSTNGLMVRGATYLGALPVKLAYALYFGNGFQAATAPANLTQVSDLGFITGGPDELSAQAYGGRLALWCPRYGFVFGGSAYSNGVYTTAFQDHFALWGFDVSYHKGNWDFRTEFANNYQQVTPALSGNINRRGLYAQLAYRNSQARNKHLSRLEGVFRYSVANFTGLDPHKLDLTAFPSPAFAPIDQNQYTFGLNYYFYPSNVLKFAYEMNMPSGFNPNYNVFMAQWAWAW
jgi:hypothetical protein